MMRLHITEKQFYEEMSPNMIQAISVIIEAENERQMREQNTPRPRGRVG